MSTKTNEQTNSPEIHHHPTGDAPDLTDDIEQPDLSDFPDPPVYDDSIIDRLLSNLNIPENPDECVLWGGEGFVDRDGYGRIGGGYVHRVVWRIFNNADIPRGDYHVHHRCGVRNCARPSHLILMLAKEHRNKCHYQSGEYSPHATHTREDVERVVELYNETTMTIPEIADELNETKSWINSVLSREIWRHLDIELTRDEAKKQDIQATKMFLDHRPDMTHSEIVDKLYFINGETTVNAIKYGRYGYDEIEHPHPPEDTVFTGLSKEERRKQDIQAIKMFLDHRPDMTYNEIVDKLGFFNYNSTVTYVKQGQRGFDEIEHPHPPEGGSIIEGH